MAWSASLNPSKTDSGPSPGEADPRADFHVRRWVFADIPAIREITLETWLDAYRAFIPEVDLRDYFARFFAPVALERVMASPDVHGYVAEDGSGPFGWMRTVWDPATRRCNMTSLYVLRRGQRHGAGRKLLEVAEHCARGYGASELWVGVMEQNTDALEWYKRRGFIIRHQAPFTMGKTTVSHCLCAKPLEMKGPEHGS
jgi:ribosomal protein S18 acetylase RimI-like enzyme